MSYRIFTISPGSTSTKCAVFEDSKLLFKENISHEPEVLKQFPTVNSQRPFRVGVVMAVLHTHGYHRMPEIPSCNGNRPSGRYEEKTF